jgi:predicted nucleic acid-binding protein
MHEIVITDTSTLILFHKIGELSLLKEVYGQIYTTREVADEFGEKLPEWIIISQVKELKYKDLLKTQIDIGEASVIALAAEYDKKLILLDDLKARKLAKQLNLKISGALGVIHKAKALDIINKVKPLINKLLKTDFRISQEIVDEILRLNNE